MAERKTTSDDSVWLVPVQSMPAVATTVVEHVLGRDLDKEGAMRLVARWSQVAGRDSENAIAFPLGKAMGFGEHPEHLAQGLSRTGRVPSAKEILEDTANDWLKPAIQSRGERAREAFTVRAVLCICGAQVDAAVTTGPNSLRRFKPVSETQDIGELDMYNSAVAEFAQLKNFTSFRGGADYSRITRHEPHIPTDEDGNLKEGYMAMKKEGKYRKVWAYCRTGDGRVAVSRHYPSAQEIAIQQTHDHYKRGKGVRSMDKCQNKEILNKGISHYVRITGLDPTAHPEGWEAEDSL